MVYHGQPRILTEIASVDLADPFVNPAGKDVPLGPQEARWNYPVPYKSGEWRLRQIVDYAVTATFAGIGHVAKNRVTWLENFYQVHADWVNRKSGAVRVRAAGGAARSVRDLRAARHPAHGEVEIHQAKAPFTANGRQYAAGSWVIKLAQPYGAFAKTMLERQRVSRPAAVPRRTTEAAVRRDRAHARPADGRRGRSDRAAVRGDPRAGADAPPGADADAGAAEVGVSRRTRVERGVHRGGAPAGGRHRRSTARRAGSRTPAARIAPGTWIVPPSPEATRILADVSISARTPGRGRRQAGAGRRVSTQAGDAHRLVAGREQHAGRLDEVAVRAVRLQPPHGRVDRFHRRPRRAVRRHRAARRHQPRHHRLGPRSQAARQGVGRGPTASAMRAGRSSPTGCAAAARSWRSDRPSTPPARCSICRSSPCFRSRQAAAAAAAGLAAAQLPAGDATRVMREAFSSPARLERRPARARRRSGVGLLLPRIAAAERVQLRAPGRVRDAGRVAGVLRIRSGLPPQARLRDPERGRLTLSGRGPDPPERLAARRGSPPRSGQRRRVPRRQRAMS